MDWEKIVEQIPTVIEKVRTDYVLNNMIIKDDIFGILEKHCTVAYYPIENEINCVFHTKRFVKNKLEDREKNLIKLRLPKWVARRTSYIKGFARVCRS